MLNNLQKRKSQSGFTIIEVMIVLAIAALILLVVLLAVPALQRSSRNTTTKNDAASISGEVSTWMTDNNGVLPTAVCYSGNTITVSDKASCAASSNNETVKVQSGYTVTFGAKAAWPTTANPASGTFLVSSGEQCNDTNSGFVTSTRSVAVAYVVETGNGTSKYSCVSN